MPIRRSQSALITHGFGLGSLRYARSCCAPVNLRGCSAGCSGSSARRVSLRTEPGPQPPFVLLFWVIFQDARRLEHCRVCGTRARAEGHERAAGLWAFVWRGWSWWWWVERCAPLRRNNNPFNPRKSRILPLLSPPRAPKLDPNLRDYWAWRITWRDRTPKGNLGVKSQPGTTRTWVRKEVQQMLHLLFGAAHVRGLIEFVENSSEKAFLLQTFKKCF